VRVSVYTNATGQNSWQNVRYKRIVQLATLLYPGILTANSHIYLQINLILGNPLMVPIISTLPFTAWDCIGEAESGCRLACAFGHTLHKSKVAFIFHDTVITDPPQLSNQEPDMPIDPHFEGQTHILARQPAFSC